MKIKLVIIYLFTISLLYASGIENILESAKELFNQGLLSESEYKSIQKKALNSYLDSDSGSNNDTEKSTTELTGRLYSMVGSPNPIGNGYVFALSADKKETVLDYDLTQHGRGPDSGRFTLKKLPPSGDVILVGFHPDFSWNMAILKVSLTGGYQDIKALNTDMKLFENDPGGEKLGQSVLGVLAILGWVAKTDLVRRHQEHTESLSAQLMRHVEGEKTDNLAAKQTALLKGAIEYRIRINGGGGRQTSTILQFDFGHEPVSLKGRGQSDAKDGGRRVGVSPSPDKQPWGDCQSVDWVDLEDYSEKKLYVFLNSKWGTDKDSTMELRVKFDKPTHIQWKEIDTNRDDLDYVKIEPIPK